MTSDEYIGAMKLISDIGTAAGWESSSSIGGELTQLRKLVTTAYERGNPD